MQHSCSNTVVLFKSAAQILFLDVSRIYLLSINQKSYMKSGLNHKLHQVDVKKLYLEASITGKKTLNLCSMFLS